MLCTKEMSEGPQTNESELLSCYFLLEFLVLTWSSPTGLRRSRVRIKRMHLSCFFHRIGSHHPSMNERSDALHQLT